MRTQKTNTNERVSYSCKANDKLDQIIAVLTCLVFDTNMDDEEKQKGMYLVLDELSAFNTVMNPVLKSVLYNHMYQRGED